MHDTPHRRSPSRPRRPALDDRSYVLERVRRAVIRGGRFACTVNAEGVVCLGASVAWCRECEAPRCADHLVHPDARERDDLCAVCGASVITFDAIKKGSAS